MFPCYIVFDSSWCLLWCEILSLLCNILLKSTSLEGHQLKINWLRPRPQYTGLPHSNTKKDCAISETMTSFSFLSIKKDCVISKTMLK